MTTRVPAHRPRRRLALAVVLVTCLMLAGVGALTGVARDTSAAGPAHAAVPIALTADDGGVVDITTQLGQGGAAAGTGMVVSPAGEVLTNYHVIKGASEISVALPGGPGYPARVLGTDPSKDVALLEVVGAPSLAPTTFGDSSKVAVGDPVTAIGNAGGVGGTPAVAKGTVTALNQSITTSDENGRPSEHLDGLIQTNARVEPGDSGGPLVNVAGQAIGMDTAAAVEQPGQPPQEPQGFAIPINDALAIVHAIEAGNGSAEVHIGPAPLLAADVLDGAFPLPRHLLPAPADAQVQVRR
jgi:S1-C subfamily serine protease